MTKDLLLIALIPAFAVTCYYSGYQNGIIAERDRLKESDELFCGDGNVLVVGLDDFRKPQATCL